MYGNLSVFQEPRGVMRIFHFIFSICAFATISGYTGYVLFSCPSQPDLKYGYDYPFQFYKDMKLVIGKNATCPITFNFDASSDARFFVATGVLGMLYSLAISIVYVKYDQLYKSNSQLPLIDFVATVIFAVLWLSSSAAWANGLTGLKAATSPEIPELCSACSLTKGSFSTLYISIVFGFLNFFLWAADLWFLYKETAWFQGPQAQSASGV